MVNHDAEFVAVGHLPDAGLGHALVFPKTPEQVLDGRNG